MEGIDLSGGSLRNCYTARGVFVGAKLVGTDLSGADLTGASLARKSISRKPGSRGTRLPAP